MHLVYLVPALPDSLAVILPPLRQPPSPLVILQRIALGQLFERESNFKYLFLREEELQDCSELTGCGFEFENGPICFLPPFVVRILLPTLIKMRLQCYTLPSFIQNLRVCFVCGILSDLLSLCECLLRYHGCRFAISRDRTMTGNLHRKPRLMSAYHLTP